MYFLFVSKAADETYYISGGLFLLVFIAIGAFVFANLVVAVVVTNLVSGKFSLLGCLPLFSIYIFLLCQSKE